MIPGNCMLYRKQLGGDLQGLPKYRFSVDMWDLLCCCCSHILIFYLYLFILNERCKILTTHTLLFSLFLQKSLKPHTISKYFVSREHQDWKDFEITFLSFNVDGHKQNIKWSEQNYISSDRSVSYKNLTLPKNRRVYISVDAW